MSGVRIRLTPQQVELLTGLIMAQYGKSDGRTRKRLANILDKLEGKKDGGYAD